jgi:hypothetical protein
MYLSLGDELDQNESVYYKIEVRGSGSNLYSMPDTKD